MDARTSAGQKVVVANCYPDDNRGSAALNEAAVSLVKRAWTVTTVSLVAVDPAASDHHSFRHSLRRCPDVHVLAPPIAVEPNRRLSGMRAVAKGIRYLALPRLGTKSPTLRAVADADLVVSRGGYVLFDPGTLRGRMSVFLTMFPNIYAKRIGKTVVSVPTAVIRPRTPGGRLLFRLLLRSFDVLCTRDPLSTKAAESLWKGRIIESVDSVFGLDFSGTPDESSLREELGLSRMSFAVMTARKEARRNGSTPAPGALGLQAQVARQSLADSVVERIVIVPQTRGSRGNRNDDRKESEQLREAIGDSRAVVLDEDFSHRQLEQLYEEATFVLTQHLHSFIIAIIANTPALVFTTDGVKVEGIVMSLGLSPELVLDSSRTHDEVWSKMRQLLDQAKLQELNLAGIRQQAAGQLSVCIQQLSRYTAERSRHGS